MAMTQLIYLICTNGSVMFGKPFLIIIYDKWEKRLTNICLHLWKPITWYCNFRDIKITPTLSININQSWSVTSAQNLGIIFNQYLDFVSHISKPIQSFFPLHLINIANCKKSNLYCNLSETFSTRFNFLPSWKMKRPFIFASLTYHAYSRISSLASRENQNPL